MKKIYIAFLFMLGISQSAFAQPANNACAGAINLTVGAGCVNGDLTGATTEGLTLPSCWTGNPSNYSTSVWYTFTATDDSITVNFGDGTVATQVLGAVFTSCAATTQVGCVKGGAEIDLTGLTVGNTYYILVDGAGTNVGTFCISTYETPPPPPPIGTCLNPRTLFVNADCDNVAGLQYDEQNNIIFTDPATGNDAGASSTGYGNPQSLDGSCTGSDAAQNAYWVEFTATATTLTFENAGTASLDYAIYTGTSCTALTAFDCYTIAGGSSVLVGGGAEPDLVVGTKYMVMITDAGTGTSNKAFLCVRGTAYTSLYNTCATALSITSNTVYNLNNSNSTADGSLCSGSMENNIWVRWTCPVGWTTDAYVHLFSQDCACNNGLQMSVYSASASCPGGSPTCMVNLNPNNSRDFYGQFTPVVGSTYYITIDGFAACACSFNFMVSGSSILPVELTDFNGIYADRVAKLNWKTGMEKDVKHFTIEKSYNGVEFTEIGKVNAAGNSPRGTFIGYNHTDTKVAVGKNYYRLKITDNNEAISYSDVISIIANKNVHQAFEVVPTVIDKYSVINLNADLYSPTLAQLKIYDNFGRVVHEETREIEAGHNKLELAVSSLNYGTYTLVINYDDHQESGRFVIK